MIHPGIEVSIDVEAGIAYITILEGEPYPSFRDVVDTLAENQIKYLINEEAINGALSRHLVGQKVAVAKARDGKAEVTISHDMMSALLIIHPAFGGKEVTVPDIRQMLVSQGIVHGVDYETVERAVEERIFEEPVVVASGENAVEGRDARIEYTFQMKTNMRPKEIEHDMVDFRELQCVFSVNKDAVLAVKTPAAPGQNGINVTGKPVVVKGVKDARFISGKGTRLSLDGLQILSDIAGQPVLKDRTIIVEPVLSVRGDVDYDTGNIDFAGSVFISGNIASGFSVRAGENIEIDGVVEDCHIEGGGDVLIKGGIQGRNKGVVKAGRNASALFVQYGVIEAGGDIVAAEVLHSTLSAGGNVFVSSGNGRILGGKVSAGNSIEAKVVGSETYVRTVLSVGFKPQEKGRLEDKKREKAAREISLGEIRKGLKVLEQRKEEGDLPEAKAVLYKQLISASEELTRIIDQLGDEIWTLEEGLEKSAKPEIRVSKVMHPNVAVTIGNLPFETKTELTFSTLRETKGQIEIVPYRS
jgi:uncharacterized protein